MTVLHGPARPSAHDDDNVALFSLIVLILIRKSIASLRLHLEHLTERLPVYHDDEAPSSASPGSSPGHQKSETGVDGAVTGPGGVTVTGVNQGAADGLSLHHEVADHDL